LLNWCGFAPVDALDAEAAAPVFDAAVVDNGCGFGHAPL
jgi:hypothetical protein